MARKPDSLENIKTQIDKEIAPEEIYNMVKSHNVLADSFESWEDFIKANLSGSRW